MLKLHRRFCKCVLKTCAALSRSRLKLYQQIKERLAATCGTSRTAWHAAAIAKTTQHTADLCVLCCKSKPSALSPGLRPSAL